MPSIEDRIAKIERSMRHWRVLSLSAALLLLALLCTGAGDQETDDTLVLESLIASSITVSKNGEQSILMEIDENGAPALSLLNGKHGSLLFHFKENNPAITARRGDKITEVTLND